MLVEIWCDASVVIHHQTVHPCVCVCQPQCWVPVTAKGAFLKPLVFDYSVSAIQSCSPD